MCQPEEKVVCGDPMAGRCVGRTVVRRCEGGFVQREAAMKVIYGLVLVLFLAAIAVFAFQNNRSENVTLLNQSWELPFPLLVGGVYLLGMLTGWTVVGLLRRSWRRVTEVSHDRPRG
jgi:uncharacterized integral membrane protein